MQLNALVLDDVLDTAENLLPTTGKKITSVITDQGVKREIVKKSQTIRLLDVMVLGPAMVYAGLGKELPDGLKTLLFLTGLGTIVYNGNNGF